MRDFALRERRKVFPCNLKNYDIACRSFLEVLKDNPDSELKEKFKRVIVKYQIKDCSCVPPELCRQPGESSDEHLERCYDAGGYEHFTIGGR